MKVLAIIQSDIQFDVDVISNLIHEDVTKNSVTEEGLSIFECGKALPNVQDWDWVALVGTCTLEIPYPIDVEISADGDAIGDLVTAVMAVKENQELDEAIELGEGS
jgi:hypothetical protein